MYTSKVDRTGYKMRSQEVKNSQAWNKMIQQLLEAATIAAIIGLPVVLYFGFVM